MKKSGEKKAVAQKSVPFQPGQTYLFRGVTHYQIGTVAYSTETEVVLSKAAWVADTGRLNEALKGGVLAEVEPFPPECLPVGIGRGALVDFCVWPHGVPEAVK